VGVYEDSRIITIKMVLLCLYCFDVNSRNVRYPTFLDSERHSEPRIGIKHYAEAWGLMFTLLIFIVLFDLKEYLEWKSVEDRVKRKIGRQIRALFAHLSIFCQVERVHYDPLSKEKKIRLVEKQLNKLASEEIRFTAGAKRDLLDENIRQSYEGLLESKLNSLGRLEERYYRFLDSEVRASLMDIQDYLDELGLEFKVRHVRDEDYFKSISDLIGKIMREILRLKRKGIWVSW